MPCLPNDFPGAVTTVPVLKNFMSLETEDVVAEEVPVALVYNGISHTVMMASPVMLEEFGTGFSLTEGIVESVSDIYDVEVIEACGSGREVRITISSEAFHNFKARRRAMLGRTGCGICGVESLGDALRPVPDLPATQTFDMRFYRDAVAQLKRFERIGAVCAADTLDLVRRNGDADARRAHDDTVLALPARDGARGGLAENGIVAALGGIGAAVLDLVAQALQLLFDVFLHGVSAVVTAQCDLHSVSPFIGQIL